MSAATTPLAVAAALEQLVLGLVEGQHVLVCLRLGLRQLAPPPLLLLLMMLLLLLLLLLLLVLLVTARRHTSCSRVHSVMLAIALHGRPTCASSW